MNISGLIILTNITTGTAQVAFIRERLLCLNIEAIVLQKRIEISYLASIFSLFEKYIFLIKNISVLSSSLSGPE